MRIRWPASLTVEIALGCFSWHNTRAIKMLCPIRKRLMETASNPNQLEFRAPGRRSVYGRFDRGWALSPKLGSVFLYVELLGPIIRFRNECDENPSSLFEEPPRVLGV